MSIKMKGIYKSFKYIAQIFVVKEREMEIGYPTDVKHVSHIGLDNGPASGSAPSWMSEFKTASSIGDISERRDSSATAVTALTHWSSHSQEFDLSIGYQSASDMSRELQQPQLPNIPKKSKRKKSGKTASSPKSSSSSSSSRLSRTAKSKAICNTIEPAPSYQL